jgi:hypothetical protein
VQVQGCAAAVKAGKPEKTFEQGEQSSVFFLEARYWGKVEW